MFNDLLDDPTVPAGTIIFAGVRESLTPALLDDASLTTAVNAVFDTSATASSRPGTSWVARPQASAVQGQWFYDLPGFERILMVTAGRLYNLASVAINAAATEITGISPALSSARAVSFCQLVDKVYMSDGLNYYEVFWDGLVWTVTHVPNFSGGSPLADFTILLTCNSGGAAFRVIGSGVNTVDNDYLYVSTSLNGQQFSSANYVRVGRGNGDPIRAIVAGQSGQLFIAKGQSIWIVDPTVPTLADWSMRAISEGVGCVAGATCKMLGQEVLFLSQKGVLSLRGLQQADGVNESVYISADIQPTIDRINWEAADTSNAVVWDNYYLLSVPLDAGLVPNAVLAYNTVTRRWSGYWTGLSPTCAVETEFANRKRTILGDTAGRLLRIDAGVSRDQTSLGTFVEIETVLETKAWNFQAPENPKQLFTVAVQFERSTGNVDVELIGDGRSAAMIEADARTNQLPQLPVQLPFTLQADTHLRRSWHLRDQPRAREVRLRLTSTAGYLRVREIKFQAFIDTVEVLR